MDVLVGFSALFAAMGFAWVAVALLGAMLLGGMVVCFFGSIFFGISRLASVIDAKAGGRDR